MKEINLTDMLIGAIAVAIIGICIGMSVTLMIMW